MKRLSPTAWFLIAIIIVMSVFFITSLGYETLKVKLMPLLMSGLTAALSVVALIQDIRSGSKKAMPTDDDGDVVEDAEKIRTPLSAYFRAYGWLAGLIAAVYFLGFIVAIPAWMFAYLWKHGDQWWKSLLMGVGMTGILYLAFTVVLQVQLYQGAIFQAVSRQLGL